MNDKRKLVAQFGQKTILVVGDVMVDSYLIGRVHRISPEAPVPVVLLEEQQNRLGGAANVALNVASLGGEAILCSVLGKDESGVLFKQLMAQEKLDTSGLIISAERKTTTKSRVFSSGQQLLRLDEEDNHYLSPEEEERLLAHIFELLERKHIDVILFQDYNKGVLTKGIIKKLIDFSRKHQIKTVVDPKRINFFEYQGVTLLKPNLKEISEAMGQEISPTKPALDRAARNLQDKMGCEKVLVTLSAKGLYVLDEDESFLLPTTTKSVADVSGAGDTVISVIALGLAADAKIIDIATLSNRAAGIVCSQMGVVPITSRALINAI